MSWTVTTIGSGAANTAVSAFIPRTTCGALPKDTWISTRRCEHSPTEASALATKPQSVPPSRQAAIDLMDVAGSDVQRRGVTPKRDGRHGHARVVMKRGLP